MGWSDPEISGFNVKLVRFIGPNLSRSTEQGSLVAINAAASPEKAEACLKYCELLYTDRKFRDTLVYGIEGKHFNYYKDTVIRTEEGNEHYLQDNFVTGAALIIPGACSSWYIIVMRTYYRNNIPAEILEAARLDGASEWMIFCRFVWPLSKPIAVTVGAFEAFSYWNSWYPNLLYTDSNHSGLYTLQYVLYNLEKSASFLSSNEKISGAVAARIPTESYRMALAVIIMVPVLVTYPLFRKFFVKGLTAGAGK
ncbi:MAG: ABC transporter permease subunit [Lachnospiraceae bacterium]|nr:ABC transporter permease subunit [Lachnospiraceae bacterium]